MTRYFCFRFDVDTHRCMSEGLPRLLSLANEVDARFTFFVNMGRAVSRLRVIKKLMKRNGNRNGSSNGVVSLSSLQKLGPRDYIRAAVLNPLVGAGYPEKLRQIEAAGHEIGLHGGRNHAHWQAAGASWPVEQLSEELKWGLRALEDAGVSRPVGFASPGWQGSRELNTALQSLGFTYVADVHGLGLEGIAPVSADSALQAISTSILGEPGGVGYIEHMRARHCPDQEILRDYTEQLEAAGQFAVVYDHPFYAGTQELGLVRAMVEVARDLGFEIAPLSEIVSRTTPRENEDGLLLSQFRAVAMDSELAVAVEPD